MTRVREIKAHLLLNRISTKLHSVLVAWYVTRLLPASKSRLSELLLWANAMKPGAQPRSGSAVDGGGQVPGTAERRRSVLPESARRSPRKEDRRRGDDRLAMGGGAESKARAAPCLWRAACVVWGGVRRRAPGGLPRRPAACLPLGRSGSP
jgi:hypothetical protein